MGPTINRKYRNSRTCKIKQPKSLYFLYQARQKKLNEAVTYSNVQW